MLDYELREIGIVADAIGGSTGCGTVGEEVVVAGGDGGVGFGGASETVRGFAVGDDVRDGARERAGFCGGEESSEVAAAAGEEDEDLLRAGDRHGGVEENEGSGASCRGGGVGLAG